MAKFSDRLGITQVPTELQVEEMSNELRNSLWNVLVSTIQGNWSKCLCLLYCDYLRQPIDDLNLNLIFPEDIYRMKFRQIFMDSSWYEVYNIVEFILQNTQRLGLSGFKKTIFERDLNYVLERELSGYRVIQDEIVKIIDEQEVESIRQAASLEPSLKLDGVRQHINNSLHLLGKKPNPDYPNSIKESISAVESACKLITGDKSGGLDRALKELSKQASLHGSLRKGFSCLYGYASDENGIRHAILDEVDIGFAEAKYMLVTCSAFINFVVEKAQQAKIL
jgi:hypothetical protein